MHHLDYPEIPFHRLLTRAAEQRPDATAITFGDRDISYAEWEREASRCANGLISIGVREGNRVGLFLPNCPEYEFAFMGIARRGAVPTPLNPSYREREVRHQLTDSGASAVVVHQSLYPTLAAAAADVSKLRHVIVVGDAAEDTVQFDQLLAGQPDTVPDVPIDLDSVASLPYSSGTTGTSKGVMLTQRNMVCNAAQYVDSTQTTSTDRLLIFLPLYHIYGVILMGVAVTAGAQQTLLERFDLADITRRVEDGAVTELFVVPPVMLALANAPNLRPEQFSRLRFIQSAAAPLAPDLARRVADRLDVHVIQAYGMTEASPLTHMVPLDEDGSEHVGVPVADTRCRIVDLETGEREMPPGEAGEVVVAGPQVMAGYWGAPEETAQTVRGEWLHTGDVGSADAEGRLVIVDRVKEMIKYKAFSIAPAELEAVLLEHAAVLDCGVAGQPDDEAGEVPKAFVVLRPGQVVTPEELQTFVAERVAGYKQIRSVEIVESIPRTPSGKILRRALKEEARTVK